MSDRAEIESIEKQLNRARRARNILREQRAGYGLRVPVETELELEEKEAQVAELEREYDRLRGNQSDRLPVEVTSNPRRVFIAYQTLEPSLSLSHLLQEKLKAAGHHVFRDRDGDELGAGWGARVDRELTECDYVLLLLSPEVATSDAITEEIRRARQLQKIILPVRVCYPFDSPQRLNYELRFHLGRVRQYEWFSEADTPAILQVILGMLDRGERPVLVEESEAIATPVLEAPNSPPLPFAEPEYPSGTVPEDSPFYIQREPQESRWYRQIEQAGALVRIKAPRQMGKTSLGARICNYAEQLGHRTAFLSLQEIDERNLQDSGQFLQNVCSLLCRDLDLAEATTSDYWREKDCGVREKFVSFLRDKLLATSDAPLTAIVDEVDRIFHEDETTREFLGCLRLCFEKAKLRRNRAFRNLRLVLIYSTEVYAQIQATESPLNVGYPIELEEFNAAQIAYLFDRHGLRWQHSDVEQLMATIGGHPFLVRQAIYAIANGVLELDNLKMEAPTNAGLYGDHLQRHLLVLERDPSLAAAFSQVIQATKAVRGIAPRLAFQLNGMGLVKLDGNRVALRYELYRDYFREYL